MQEPLTLYKLIILYMLNRVDFSISRAQISDFMLEKEYTTFLTLQQAISDLIDAGMIKTVSNRNRTQLLITTEGVNTLSYFGNQVGESIKEEIDQYFIQHGLVLRNEGSVQADYYKSTSGEYEAHLIAKEKDIVLIDITMSVPVKETAISICDNWQKKNQSIYKYLIEELFQ